MKNILFLIVLLFSSCALRPEKLIGTYSGTCDGTPVSIKLPENGLWQLSKDTIIIFEQNGNAVSNFVVPKDWDDYYWEPWKKYLADNRDF